MKNKNNTEESIENNLNYSNSKLAYFCWLTLTLDFLQQRHIVNTNTRHTDTQAATIAEDVPSHSPVARVSLPSVMN